MDKKRLQQLAGVQVNENKLYSDDKVGDEISNIADLRYAAKELYDHTQRVATELRENNHTASAASLENATAALKQITKLFANAREDLGKQYDKPGTQPAESDGWEEGGDVVHARGAPHPSTYRG